VSPTVPANTAGSRLLRYAVGSVLLGAAYYLGALAALSLASDANKIAYIWPPTGVAVAVLFRISPWCWPGVFVGALACELAIFPWWVAVGIASGNTAGPLFAVALLRRAKFDASAAGRRALYALLLAGGVGMTLTATNALVWRAAAGLPTADLAPCGWRLTGV